MLDGLEKSAGSLAEAFITPPLDIAGLRRDWSALRKQVARIPSPNLPSPDVLRHHWDEQEAANQN